MRPWTHDMTSGGHHMRKQLTLMLVLLSLALPFTGCSGMTGGAKEEKTIWILKSFSDDSVRVTSFDSTVPNFTLADGKVSGHLSVNFFNGTYELSGKDISFSSMASTKKACPPEAMEQETQFLAALGAAASVEVQDGQLTVSDSDGVVVMRLTQALEG